MASQSLFLGLMALALTSCSKQDSSSPPSDSLPDAAVAATAAAPLDSVVIRNNVESDSKPDGSAALARMIRQQSKGLIELASYQKTNGLDEEFGGVKYYTVEYNAEIEVTEDCYRYAERSSMHNDILPNERFICRLDSSIKEWDRGQIERPGVSIDPNNKLVLAQKGSRAVVTGVLKFQLAENGWRELRRYNTN